VFFWMPGRGRRQGERMGNCLARNDLRCVLRRQKKGKNQRNEVEGNVTGGGKRGKVGAAGCDP